MLTEQGLMSAPNNSCVTAGRWITSCTRKQLFLMCTENTGCFKSACNDPGRDPAWQLSGSLEGVLLLQQESIHPNIPCFITVTLNLGAVAPWGATICFKGYHEV